MGKYCSQCAKKVIDFTSLNDHEVIQILEQRTEKVCGRLAQQQLNRIIKKGTNRNRHLFYNTLAGLLLMGNTEDSFAENHLATKQEIASAVNNPIANNIGKNDTKPAADSLKNIIQGKVIDALSKEPLPFVPILVKGTKTGTTADQDGQFKLVIPDSLMADTVTLQIIYIGYESKEVVIHRRELSKTKMLLVIPAETAMMGEVCIVKRKRWWQFWK